MFELTPYRNPYAATLGNLIGGADRARAAGMRQSGQAIAQGVQQIGEQTGATLNNLVRLQLDQPRREMEKIQLTREQRAEQDDKDAKQAFQDAQGDPNEALKLLETKGNYQVAMKLRGQLNQQRIQDLDVTTKTLTSIHQRLEQASALVQGVQSAQDPASAWTPNLVGRIRELVGEKLAASVPDQYNADFANQALTWGMKTTDQVRMRRDAAQAASAGLRSAVTKTELTLKLTDATAKWAQTVDSQEEWDNARKQIKTLGGDVADSVLSRFPTEFSDALKTTALKIGQTDLTAKFQHETVAYTGADGKVHIEEANYNPATGAWTLPGRDAPLAKVRKFQRDPTGQVDVAALTKAVLDHPEAYNDLTDTAKTAIWPALNAAGFTPPPSKDRGASASTAERWRMNALATLDKDFRASKLAGPNDPTAMTQAEYDTRKAAIEASYKIQLGHGGAPPTPAAPTKPAAGTPAPSPKPAATAHDLLKGRKPGTYTLTDGTVWVVGKDGRITPLLP